MSTPPTTPPQPADQYESTAVDYRQVPQLADTGILQLVREADALMLEIEIAQEKLESHYRPAIQMLVELYAVDPKFKTISVEGLLRITQTVARKPAAPKPDLNMLRLGLEKRGIELNVIDAEIAAATPAPKPGKSGSTGITITRLGPSPLAKPAKTEE
jgi:hypothetical protein